MGDPQTPIPLPERVETMIEQICKEQKQPHPDADARKILASIGEEKSLHMLTNISQTRIKKSFSGFIKYKLRDYRPKPLSMSPNSTLSTPHKRTPSSVSG